MSGDTDCCGVGPEEAPEICPRRGRFGHEIIQPPELLLQGEQERAQLRSFVPVSAGELTMQFMHGMAVRNGSVASSLLPHPAAVPKTKS